MTIRTPAPIMVDKDQIKLFQITFFSNLLENNSLFSHLFQESLNYHCSCHTSNATFLSSFETPLEMKLLPECSRGRSSHLITLVLKTGNRSFSPAAPVLVGVCFLPFCCSCLSYSSAVVLILDFAWQLFGAECIAERRRSTSAGLLP